MQTPSFLPIPSSGHSGSHHHTPTPPGHDSFPRQASYDVARPGPSRYGDAAAGQPTSGLSAMMQRQHQESPPSHSPSSNPHSGFHPSSFGAPLSFSALALGATTSGSSPYASSMAMSISPPRWAPGSMGGGGFTSGSYVGSALGTSFGRQAEGRERELEAKYVKDFTCCGHQLSGLHELLEHYEEDHAELAPDVRLAAINAAQALPGAAAKTRAPFVPMSHGDAPTPPGMMDIEMDEPPAGPSVLPPQLAASLTVNLLPGATPPWSAAFRNMPTTMQPPACVPPSVLSYPSPTPRSGTPTRQAQTTKPSSSQNGAHAAATASATPTRGQSPILTSSPPEKIVKKKRVEKEVDMDADDAPAAPAAISAASAAVTTPTGEKRFRCPIEGCGKVYKQANGLKYHLTRSINSGHGNVAAMGGLMALLDEKE